MLQALENLKDHAEAMKVRFEAGIGHIEQDFAALLAKIEHAFDMHKAATGAAPSIPEIEVTEGAPLADGGYPPINQVADECATPAAEVLASSSADAAPAASDPAPAAPAP